MHHIVLSQYLDAEDIFADADSVDAVPRRPGIGYSNADSMDAAPRRPGFLNAIQISDDEMDAVWLYSHNKLLLTLY